MSHWPDRRILDLLGIELPILQAPMAGATGSAMAIAVGLAGGLGALPCAMLSGEQVRAEIAAFRAGCPGRPRRCQTVRLSTSRAACWSKRCARRW